MPPFAVLSVLAVAFGVAGWLFAQWIHARSEPSLPCEAERMRW